LWRRTEIAAAWTAQTIAIAAVLKATGAMATTVLNKATGGAISTTIDATGTVALTVLKATRTATSTIRTAIAAKISIERGPTDRMESPAIKAEAKYRITFAEFAGQGVPCPHHASSRGLICKGVSCLCTASALWP
jgi:hypothetical protein